MLVTKGRTITEADLLTFAGFSGDFMPLHVDETYAKATRYGSRILHGNATLSLCCGLIVQTGVFENHLGMLAMEYKLPAPVRIGDTLHAELDEIESHPTPSGRYEVAIFAFRGVIQDATIVLDGKWTQLRPRPGTGNAAKTCRDPEEA